MTAQQLNDVVTALSYCSIEGTRMGASVEHVAHGMPGSMTTSADTERRRRRGSRNEGLTFFHTSKLTPAHVRVSDVFSAPRT